MKHIIRQGSTFLLSTEHSALLLRVTKYGHIELLHYGAPVPIEDADALSARRTMPYGSRDVHRGRSHLLPC